MYRVTIYVDNICHDIEIETATWVYIFKCATQSAGFFLVPPLGCKRNVNPSDYFSYLLMVSAHCESTQFAIKIL
jgi:hypothetical protein